MTPSQQEQIRLAVADDIVKNWHKFNMDFWLDIIADDFTNTRVDENGGLIVEDEVVDRDTAGCMAGRGLLISLSLFPEDTRIAVERNTDEYGYLKFESLGTELLGLHEDLFNIGMWKAAARISPSRTAISLLRGGITEEEVLKNDA